MGERFYNNYQIADAVAGAMLGITDAYDALVQNEARITDAADLELLKFDMALMSGVLELGKTVAALNTMVSILAAGLDKGWMIDGPGIDPDTIARS